MTFRSHKNLLFIDNFNLVLSFYITTYFSLQIQVTFLFSQTVNIDTSWPVNSNCLNYQTAKIIDPCLMCINLTL